MSVLFGGHEFLCDGCGDVIAVTQRDRHTDHPIIGFVRDLGVVTIELSTNPGKLEGAKLARHFCPKCAPVATDTFRAAFGRIGAVLAICEREDGDPTPPPEPRDPRARTVTTRMRGVCPVDGRRFGKTLYVTESRALCSVECADKYEQNSREREEFLRLQREQKATS